MKRPKTAPILFALFLALGGGALRAAAEPYPLWIGGDTQVTSDNADDVFSNTTVRFEGDATGGTLFFKDADLRAYTPPPPGVLFTNILAENDFKLAIALEGTNFVRADGMGGHGIYADGGLSIRGGGTLEVGPVPEKAIGTKGAFVVEDGAVVTAQGGSFGIGAGADIVLSNATVTAAGSNSGLYTTGGKMWILGRSTVSASGAQALYAEGGIEIGEGLAVVLPVGGGVSADGTTIVDAAGNTAERVVIAAPGTLLGSGTEENPYVIYDYATLVAFAEAVNGGQKDAWGVLAADIVAEGTNWVGIGADSYHKYAGTFDGAGHTISKLGAAGTPATAGLFSVVGSGGVVRNVRLAGVVINGEDVVGGIVDYNYGMVSNCCVSGSVQEEGDGEAGGVVGDNFGTVANCHNTGAVSGLVAGGIVGCNDGGTVRNCHSTGAVSGGGGDMGGVVGFQPGGTVANCYCPDSLGVRVIGENHGHSERCAALSAAEYTQTNSFSGWNFEGVWGMGPEGPYLRVFGDPEVYPVWVGGRQVWEENAKDIFGDGSAWFEGTATNGTLVLSNAVITNAVAYEGGVGTVGIYAGSGFDLTVSLAGSNRVENSVSAGRGIRMKGNLTLCGEGSLTVKSGAGVDGISADGNLRIEGATVAASGGAAGFASSGNIVLSNATVTATGTPYGMYADGQVAFAGDSRVDATARGDEGSAVRAQGGIAIGEGLAVVVPVGGGRSSDGRTIVDAEGNTAKRAVLAAPGSVVGSGTEADPYVIYDYGTLVAFAEAVNGGQGDAWGVLAADIVAEGSNWVAIGIGAGNICYAGTFDGAGHTISGLANERTPINAGLFGWVNGGVVRNVRLAEVSFNGTHAGGVAGDNAGTVSNCCVSGRVRGTRDAGGVVGDNAGTVANCHNTGAVSGDVYVGGVVGENEFGEVRNCHSTGAVTGGGCMGGLVGDNYALVTSSYCPDSLGVGAIGADDGTVDDCRTLTAAEYTQTNSFSGWDFERVWGMGPVGPYLRVFGEPVAYPVWVGGTRVWEGNAGDIFGDGTARFEGTATNGTLVLSNAVITNAYTYDGIAASAGIYAGDGFDLTISLDGSNRVENAVLYGSGIQAGEHLSIGGKGSLTAAGGESGRGIYAYENLRIEDATVVATSSLGGFSCTHNIVLSNATVIATGSGFGFFSSGAIAFSGASRVEATATDSDGIAVLAQGGITVGAELRLVEPDGGGLEDGRQYFVDAGGNEALYVRIEPSESGYDLWVGGVQVGSGNAGDILGDGSARFEGTAAGGTLALSNAVVTNAVRYQSGMASTACIYAGSGVELTISLAGSNRLANAAQYGYGIHAAGNLAIAGDGALAAEGGENSAGIDVVGNLRIEGTTVAASGLHGLHIKGNIVFTNATVSATGAGGGIKANVSVAFAGDSRVEATGTDYGIYSGESISFAGGSRVEATGTEYGIYSDEGTISFAEYCRVEATGSEKQAIHAKAGITIEEWLGVAQPFGGGAFYDDGAEKWWIADAGGNAATNALVARFYEIMVTGGSSTNQYAVEGASIEVTANEPVDGRAFVQWSSTNGLDFADAGASPTRFTMPATNVAVEAVFQPIVLTWRDDPAEYPYTGGEIEPPFDVALEGVDLYLGTNYTVSWADNVNVGTATLTVTLTNGPTGVQSNSFRIKPKALDEEAVELNLPTVGWCTFDGTALQPGFNIKDPALHESDLVVVWTNNVGPGTASVLFTGTNNYAGRVEKTFEIKWASERVDGTEWSYRTDLGGGTNATVTGASPAEGELTVPGTLGGVPVAGIGDGAFAGCTNLTGFVMGNGVSSVGERAFEGCTGLTNVVLGAGIESVGANAFAGCDALETVWVPIGQQGTGLLDAAGLPAGCVIRYYGTQTVTFDANGGACGTTNGEFEIGAAYGALPEAEREGHAFQGWWTAKDGGTRVAATNTVPEEAERTLWARWEANEYAVTLDAQGGKGGTAGVTATYGEAMPGITPPKRTDRAFSGYFTGKGGTGRQYYTAAGESAAAWGEAAGTAATLYASWTAKPRAERASYHDPDSAYWDVEFGTPGAALGHGDYAAASGGTNIACTTNPSGARTWGVPGAADPGILQRAVDQARPGDSIKVGPGCYGAVVVGKDRISISSTKGRMRTFVNGEYGARCVDFGSTAGGRISGFTLVQGDAGSGDGGGIRGGSASQCLIEGCRAEHGGGAAMSSLSDCLLTWNEAAASGGGAYGGSLMRCEVRHNEAAIGGGAVATRATGTLFAGNEATGKAGGAEQSTLMACTVADNRAGAAAGVSGCTVKNSVLHGNRLWSGATNNHEGSTCQYTCAWPVPAGTGNFNAAPNFADPAEENYHPSNYSKCRDRGNQALSATPWDLAGLDRTMGTNTDAGCYEYATEVRPLAPADYDGDGQPDVGFFRPSNGTWFLRQSSDGTVRRVSLGNEKSTLVPRDWDGDGVRDPAVYDPNSGTWTMVLSATKETATKKLGWKGITAVDAADWDGDGAADPIIFNPASKTWQILQSGNGATAVVRDFGWGGIKVFCGDYDGDGLAELGFYSATSFIWYARGRDGMVRTMKLGAEGAKPCPVDFDMDGALDPCCFLPATGTWTWKSFVTGEEQTVKFGDSTITPYPFDWNSDGMPDSLGFYSPYRAGFLDLYRKADGSLGTRKICF